MPCLMITVIYRVGALISVGAARPAEVGLASLDHFQLNAFASDGTNLTAQEMWSFANVLLIESLPVVG